MVLKIELTDELESRVKRLADENGQGNVRLWINSAFKEWLDRLEDQEFEAIVDDVIEKNAELYKRLA